MSVRYERLVTAGLVASIGSSLYSRSAVNYSSSGNSDTRQEGYTSVDLDWGPQCRRLHMALQPVLSQLHRQRFVGYI